MNNPKIGLLFSDHFHVGKATIDTYGAYNISLIADLPLFIDPFLLFNSQEPQYQSLHEDIIRYLRFLRDKSVKGSVDKGQLAAWYTFREVKQTWLGFSGLGNGGSGLGREFAEALNENFHRIFAENDVATITKGRHLEKLCLIKEGVGRDNISDFTTNLIKGFLLEYTQAFAQAHIAPEFCRTRAVTRARFNYDTESWETVEYYLPEAMGDYVLLVPKNILTRDETWINRSDLIDDFDLLPAAIPDEAIRSQIDNYFRKALPEDEQPTAKERKDAIHKTIREFPEIIDYFIKYKEENGDQAKSLSDAKVARAIELFQNNFYKLVELLASETEFYDLKGNSYDEAYSRVLFLKRVIEKNNGYRLFYSSDGNPIKREEDLQVAYFFTWYNTSFDVNREVDNGRGPVDYKVSKGARDKSLVEFKLASNSQLKRNLKNQVAIYEEANQTWDSIKVILYFTEQELEKVLAILDELELSTEKSIVVIDARRDNKPSASKA